MSPHQARTFSRNRYVLTEDSIAHLRRKTVVIAGASGYIGTALIESLRDADCRVVALTTRSTENTLGEDPDIVWRQSDLQQSDAWTELLRVEDPYAVFHLAAHEHRRGSLRSPVMDLAVNATSVLHLLESCASSGRRPRIIFASSANVAGCSDTLPVTESARDQPLTLYAIHKLTAEHYLRHYASSARIPSVILRFANVYGVVRRQPADVISRPVLNRMMQQGLHEGEVRLFANRACRRDYVHISDVIRALLVAAAHPALTDGSSYLVGSEDGHTIEEAARLIIKRVTELFGRQPLLAVDDGAALEPIEHRQFVANCERLRAATNWSPTIRLHEGIDDSLRSLESYARAVPASPATNHSTPIS